MDHAEEPFIRVEAASALALLSATVVALAWANSPWAASYDAIWRTPHASGLVGTALSPHFAVNDGLMTLFFFLAGLELRHELHDGELSTPRRAALPLVAAIGGMLAPAAIYLCLNVGSPARRGWGVPMATDIAFAVGVLQLLGRRVPAALRVLLLGLAVVDDIGAALVIGVFYSPGLSPLGAVVALGGVAAVLAFQRAGVGRPALYVAPAAVIWFGLLRAGIHPALAGVVVGGLTPVRTASCAQVERLQTRLHPWVAFGVLPLFALANGGVRFGGVSLAAPGVSNVVAGVVLGLVLGKPAGIVLASAASVRLGLAHLPEGVRWPGVAVVGAVAGIGFTMAIFVAELAFPGDGLGVAKLGVLAASATAAAIGLVAGRIVLPAAALTSSSPPAP